MVSQSTHIGIHPENVAIVLVCFGILRYVSKHSFVLRVLSDVRDVSHVVMADHNLRKCNHHHENQ